MVPGSVALLVPGASVDDVVTRLERYGAAGRAAEHDGRTVVHLVADDEGVLVQRSGEEILEHLTVDGLRALLEPVWSDVRVGEDADADDYRAVAVMTVAGHGLGAWATKHGHVLHRVRRESRLVVGTADPGELDEEAYVDALQVSEGVTVLLWARRGALGVRLIRWTGAKEGHTWHLDGRTFGPSAVLDSALPEQADAAELGKRLRLDQAAVTALRSELLRARPHLPALAAALGLPREAVEVVEGRTTIDELPGAEVVESLPWWKEVGESAKTSEDDPGWMRALDDGSRELRPWYLAGSFLLVALGAWLVLRWIDGGSAFWGVVGLVLAAGEVAEVVVRWVQKRRRGRRP